jgi:hypothetical protein
LKFQQTFVTVSPDAFGVPAAWHGQVRRPFPGIDLSLADPFLLLDHMGAVEYAPGEAKP